MAASLAKEFASPDEYRKRIDRMLMWMGRYGRQSVVEIAAYVSMADLRNFVALLSEFLDKEVPENQRK